jgi:hypothetical protein
MPKRSANRTRRTPEQIIEDLQKKIDEVKARAARAKVKKDHAMRHIGAAVRSIDKAAKATVDAAMRKALESARVDLSACLELGGASMPRAARRGGAVDPQAVLDFLTKNGSSSAEQAADALGTDTKSLRPVLRKLIDSGAVKATGQKRGTRYRAA